MREPPTCPNATVVRGFNANDAGMRWTAALVCPVSGSLALEQSMWGPPPDPHWVGYCGCVTTAPAYGKAPNPSPVKKKAQDLMTEALNRDTANLLAASICDTRGMQARLVMCPPDRPTVLSYATALVGPLPEGVEVGVRALSVSRGQLSAHIGTIIAGGRVKGWLLTSWDGLDPRWSEDLYPQWRETQVLRFKTSHEAVQHAVKWLDAVVAWAEARRAAEKAMAAVLGTEVATPEPNM